MPAARTTRRTWWIVGLSLLLVASCLALTAGLGMLASGRLDRWLEQPHVAEIRIRGPIALRGGAGLLTGESASAERIVEQLERARQNPNARVVLLRVDSPGVASMRRARSGQQCDVCRNPGSQSWPFSRTLPRPAVITSVRRPTVSSPCLTPSPAVSG